MDNLPPTEIDVIDGHVWMKRLDDDDFVYLGYAPSPRNGFEGFIYHVAHGLLMRYPLFSVIKFAWINRHSFQDDTIHDERETA